MRPEHVRAARRPRRPRAESGARPASRSRLPFAAVIGVLASACVAEGETSLPSDAAPPPLLVYVAPRDTLVGPNDTVFYRVVNSDLPASAWRWSASDTTIVAIDAVTGVAVARKTGQTGVRARAAVPLVTATTNVTVRQ
jgi:hypothetical protein